MSRYCDKCDKHGPGFMTGVFWGTVVGAVLGVLYAPESGNKTREKIKTLSDNLTEKGQNLYDDATELAEDVKLASAPLMDEIEKNVKPVLKKAKGSGKDVQFQVLEKIEQLVEEMEDTPSKVKKAFKKK